MPNELYNLIDKATGKERFSKNPQKADTYFSQNPDKLDAAIELLRKKHKPQADSAKFRQYIDKKYLSEGLGKKKDPSQLGPLVTENLQLRPTETQNPSPTTTRMPEASQENPISSPASTDGSTDQSQVADNESVETSSQSSSSTGSPTADKETSLWETMKSSVSNLLENTIPGAAASAMALFTPDDLSMTMGGSYVYNQEQLKAQREQISAAKNEAMKFAGEKFAASAEERDKLVSNISDIDDPLDLANYLVGAASEAAVQIPLTLATFGGSSLIQSSGSVYYQALEEYAQKNDVTVEEAIKQNKDAKLGAMLTGAISAALDRVGAGKVAKSIKPEAVLSSLRKRVLEKSKDVVGSGMEEGATEMVQEAIESIGAGVGSGQTVLEAIENLDGEQLINAGARGLAGGTTLSGAGNVASEVAGQGVKAVYGEPLPTDPDATNPFDENNVKAPEGVLGEDGGDSSANPFKNDMRVDEEVIEPDTEEVDERYRKETKRNPFTDKKRQEDDVEVDENGDIVNPFDEETKDVAQIIEEDGERASESDENDLSDRLGERDDNDATGSANTLDEPSQRAESNASRIGEQTTAEDQITQAYRRWASDPEADVEQALQELERHSYSRKELLENDMERERAIAEVFGGPTTDEITQNIQNLTNPDGTREENSDQSDDTNTDLSDITEEGGGDDNQQAASDPVEVSEEATVRAETEQDQPGQANPIELSEEDQQKQRINRVISSSKDYNNQTRTYRNSLKGKRTLNEIKKNARDQGYKVRTNASGKLTLIDPNTGAEARKKRIADDTSSYKTLAGISSEGKVVYQKLKENGALDTIGQDGQRLDIPMLPRDFEKAKRDVEAGKQSWQADELLNWVEQVQQDGFVPTKTKAVPIEDIGKTDDSFTVPESGAESIPESAPFLVGSSADPTLGLISGLPRKAKRIYQKYVRSRGDLPHEVFDEKIYKEGRISKEIRQVARVSAKARRSIKKSYGKGWEAKLPDVNAALRGEKDITSLPSKVQESVREMRAHIKSLSKSMIDEGVVSGEMKAVFDKNMDTYLNRSYKIFDDPKWAENVPTQVMNRAKSYLRSHFKSQNQNLTEDQLNGYIKAFLAKKGEKNPISILASSKLGAKNLGSLKQRKDIPAPIRALMGEYDDVLVNYSKSVAKMAQVLHNHKFLSNIKQIGMGEYFFEGENPPDSKHHVQISAETNESLAPLNGLWTTPEIKKAFEDFDKLSIAQGEGLAPAMLRGYMKATGYYKAAKTVFNPITHARNFSGGVYFTLANGHWRQQHGFKAFATNWNDLGGRKNEKLNSYLDKLTELGVVGGSVDATYIRETLEEAKRRDGDVQKMNESWFHKYRNKAGKKVMDAYQKEDDFWKIIAFENEKARYKNDFKSEEELERHAAQVVRNTLPNYDMLGQGLKQAKYLPFTASFLSFPAEIVRTTGNILKITHDDLKAGRVQAGMERMAGTMGAAALTAGIATMLRMEFGVDDEDDESARRFMAPWDKNGSIAFVGPIENGRVDYINLSYTDPYSYWQDPFHTMLRGATTDKDIGDASMEALGQMLNPFMDEEMLVSRILDASRNKIKASGAPIYNEKESFFVQNKKKTAYVLEGLEPGVANFARRLYMASTGQKGDWGQEYEVGREVAANLMGLRRVTLDVRQSIGFRFRNFNSELIEAKRIYTSVAKRRGNVSEEELEDAYQRANEAYRKTLEEYQQYFEAGVAMKVPYKEMRDILGDKEVRISKENEYIIAGLKPIKPLEKIKR